MASTFSYTGGMQTYTTPSKGIYKLTVNGARGGASGGLGGSSTGYKLLDKNTILYICVGQQGYGRGVKTAAYNGGGKGSSSETASGGAGGGGATHIALVTGTIASIGKTTFDSQGLIVAGGGGGSAEHGSYGTGGGENGGNGRTRGGATIAGGTQTTGYAFGQGQDGYNGTGSAAYGSNGKGGGGGGYYGGRTYTSNGENSTGGGGGGSGWIGGVLNATTTNGVNSGDGSATIEQMVSVNSNGNGSVDISYDGTNAVVTATPNSGYKFSYFSVNGTSVTSNPYTFTLGQNTIEITAYFELIYDIDVTIDSNFGSASLTWQGYDVMLIASLKSGASFNGWYFNGSLLSSENPYSFTPSQDMDITASVSYQYSYNLTYDSSLGSATITRDFTR